MICQLVGRESLKTGVSIGCGLIYCDDVMTTPSGQGKREGHIKIVLFARGGFPYQNSIQIFKKFPAIQSGRATEKCPLIKICFLLEQNNIARRRAVLFRYL